MIRLCAWFCSVAAVAAADIAGSDVLAPALLAGVRQVAPAGKTVDLAGTLAARRGLAADLRGFTHRVAGL